MSSQLYAMPHPDHNGRILIKRNASDLSSDWMLINLDEVTHLIHELEKARSEAINIMGAGEV